MDKMTIAVAVVAFLLGAGVGYFVGVPRGANWASLETMRMSNPAAAHCIDIGGELEIGDGAEGQFGLCRLPDGRVCEEWALFRDGTCALPE